MHTLSYFRLSFMLTKHIVVPDDSLVEYSLLTSLFSFVQCAILMSDTRNIESTEIN